MSESNSSTPCTPQDDTPKPVYACSDCGKSYKSVAWLKKHTCADKKRKDGDEPSPVYQCKECLKTYKTSHGIKSHVCKQQPEEEPNLDHSKIIYPCGDCGRTFETVAGLKIHKCGLEKKAPKTKVNYKCTYCKRKFSTERGMGNHRCKIRMRLDEVKSTEGRMAFFAFHYYFKMTTNSNAREKTIDDFIRSQLYTEFLKFGTYIAENKIPRYEEYIKYLHKYSVPIRDWSNDKVYCIYAKTITMRESMESAVERTFSTMTSWAKQHNTKWFDYFRLENKYRIIQHVKMGKISPWVIYNSSSGEDFINRLDRRDLDEIYDLINPTYWGTQFKRYSVHALAARNTLKEAGL